MVTAQVSVGGAWKGENNKVMPKCTIHVDKGLPTDEFEDARTIAYWQAVRKWNDVDKSNRVRIPSDPVETCVQAASCAA